MILFHFSAIFFHDKYNLRINWQRLTSSITLFVCLFLCWPACFGTRRNPAVLVSHHIWQIQVTYFFTSIPPFLMSDPASCLFFSLLYPENVFLCYHSTIFCLVSHHSSTNLLTPSCRLRGDSFYPPHLKNSFWAFYTLILIITSPKLLFLLRLVSIFSGGEQQN